jgi:hypothetical protein
MNYATALLSTASTFVDGVGQVLWPGDGNPDIILHTIGDTLPRAVRVQQTP